MKIEQTTVIHFSNGSKLTFIPTVKEMDLSKVEAGWDLTCAECPKCGAIISVQRASFTNIPVQWDERVKHENR